MNAFGERIRSRREALAAEDPRYGLRRLAERLEVSPSWLSGLETGKATGKASEEVITKLAAELGENPDVLLALVGKVSSRLERIIIKQPELFAQLIEKLDNAPPGALIRIVREVRDGDW